MNPTFLHFLVHLCTRLVVTSYHSEAEPPECPLQVLSIRICSLTICHARLTAEGFVVDYKGRPPSGMTHIVDIVFIPLGIWTAVIIMNLLYFGYYNTVLVEVQMYSIIKVKKRRYQPLSPAHRQLICWCPTLVCHCADTLIFKPGKIINWKKTTADLF